MKKTSYRAEYDSQKSGAAARGIAWEFTYETWLDWWGDDIDRRGVHYNSLQMQRNLDAGPYAPGNVIKGTPKTNRKTCASVAQNKKSLAAGAIKELLQDAMMAAPSEPPQDELVIPGKPFVSAYERKKLKTGRLFGRPLKVDLAEALDSKKVIESPEQKFLRERKLLEIISDNGNVSRVAFQADRGR